MRNQFFLSIIAALSSTVLTAAPRAIVPSGTDVLVRVDETIDSKTADEGRVYAAQLDQDLLDSDGRVVAPRGSKAELLVREAEPGKDLVLDLESIFIDGHRYFVTADDYDRTNRRPSIGRNRRTAEMTGGGAIVGSILGALGGGGKGAAIGAASGGAAGGLLQVLTRGKSVRIPVETVLTFHLERPLRLYEVR